MAGMPYLLDSNILLRWVKPDHNDYPLVVSAIEAILRRDGELCYTSQNVGEFWNTCTRPIDRNGYACLGPIKAPTLSAWLPKSNSFRMREPGVARVSSKTT
jgi:hypothetical protein